MKSITFLFLSLNYLSFSQVSQKDIDYISYYNNIHEANYYFYEQDYELAIIYYERGLKYVNTPRGKDYYNYCKALLKTGHQKFPEFELAHSSYIITQRVFGIDSVFFDGISLETKYDIVANAKNNGDKLNDPHSKFIDSLMEKDQAVRQRNDTIPKIEFEALMKFQDSLNQIALINYSKKNGFPAGINNGWGQTISTMLLHFNREWFIENYHFLLNEVKIGNLEPWMLSRGMDRQFIIDQNKATIPFNDYYQSELPDPFLIFKNCSTIGTSPYYYFDDKLGVGSNEKNRKVYYEIYKANKKVYNLTLFQ